MISPHTPPGTKVIALSGGAWDVVAGRTYTVSGWTINRDEETGELEPSVLLCETKRAHYGHIDLSKAYGPRGFSRNAFRYAELPRTITDALKSQPLVPVRQRAAVSA